MNVKIVDVGKLFLLLCACGRVTAQYGYPATSSYGSMPASNSYSGLPVTSGYGSYATPAPSSYGYPAASPTSYSSYQTPSYATSSYGTPSYSLQSYPQFDPYAMQFFGSQSSYGLPTSYGGYPAALPYTGYTAAPYITPSYDPYAQSYGGYPDSSGYSGYDSYGGMSPYGASPYGYGDYRGDQSLLGGLNKMEDSNRNGIPDHLEMTKSKIDDYLAKTQTLGSKKLSVSVNYLNTPLEYQYLNQYHGFGHPLSGTTLGDYLGVPSQPVVPPPQTQQYVQPPQQFVQPPQSTQFQTPPQQVPQQQMRDNPTPAPTQAPNTAPQN